MTYRAAPLPSCDQLPPDWGLGAREKGNKGSQYLSAPHGRGVGPKPPDLEIMKRTIIRPGLDRRDDSCNDE